MLEVIEEAAREAGVAFRGLKKGSGDNPESFFESAHIETSTKAGDVPPDDAIGLIAGTPWAVREGGPRVRRRAPARRRGRTDGPS
jgi:hypothetical protein